MIYHRASPGDDVSGVGLDRAFGVVVHEVERELVDPEGFQFDEPFAVALHGTQETEAVDYLVTQAMAEYLAERVEPPLDGILYRSAQGGETSFNVALFNKAARVEARTLPPGSKTSVELYEQNEDGWEENYTIWDEVPEATSPPPPSSSGPDFAAILAGSSFRDDDDREVALRLDRSTLRLQHISGVTISTSERTIFQHQTEPYSAVDDADSHF